MKRLMCCIALGLTLFGAPVSPSLIASVEASMNKRIRSLWPGEEFVLLAHVQGLYLDGFGCVFTTRVNLAEGPGESPFRQQLPESARAELHKKKLERLPVFRAAMREMLANAAGSLDPVPADQNLVLSASLLYLPHEVTTGLPSQIVMRAQRKALIPLLASKDKAALTSAIQTQEY